MLITSGQLTVKTLEGQVAIVTGAGRGIGYQAARSLIAIGAKVVLAEVDKKLAAWAHAKLTKEFGVGMVASIPTDVGHERSVERLKKQAVRTFGKVDIVINNATIAPLGAVTDVQICKWDASYRVNLRGPVLLAKAFVPAMLQRDYGVYVCVSSVGDAFMGAYETFKAAQVHLANTLDAELDGTGVHVFTISPGLVRTPGAEAGIKELAPLYGKTVEEFYALSQEHLISVEEAGAGFAAAVALASQFHGQEISSKQALLSAGIDLGRTERVLTAGTINATDLSNALILCRRVRETLREQSQGWSERSMFERQWMYRNFKKNAGMPVEQWLDTLADLESALELQDAAIFLRAEAQLQRLVHFYRQLQDLARGYEKDARKLAEQLRIIQEWRDDAEALWLLSQGSRPDPDL